MKKLLVGIGIAMTLSGCGPSQANLKEVNDLLEKSKTADCETIHSYLDQIQKVIQTKIK